METLATLAMDIDVRSADPAEAKLASLKQTAKELEDQVGRTAAAAKGLGSGYEQAGAAAGRGGVSVSKYSGALTEQAQLMLRNAQLQDRWAKDAEKTAKQTDALAKRVDALRAVMDPLAAVETTLAQRTKLLDEALAKGAISAQQHAAMLAKVQAAAKAGSEQIARYGSSTKQTTALMGQLAPQINDVVTGLISGQKPFQILAQQGGQIYQALQMGPGGVGGSLKSLAGLLNPTTVGVVALGAAFGGLALAAYDAEKRTAAFGALARTVGQDLGLSGDQLQALAATSAAASKSSIRDAEDWTQAYVRMGVASADVLGRAVTDTKALARALAVDGANAAELLGAALADPLSSLDALAKKTGGFDEALKENIKSLARHGELAQADALILSEVERRTGGAADGVNTLSGAYDRLKTSIGNYIAQAGKLVFTNPGQMQVAETYRGFGYNPVLEQAQSKAQAAANDNRDQALGGAARDAYNAILPKVQQIKALQDQQVALQNTINAGAGALKAANLTADQARAAIKEADKKITELKRDKTAERDGNRAIRVGNRGDNAIEQARAAELTAQLSTTKNVETLADLKRQQIDQEVEVQRVRLQGQVKAKEISKADADAAMSAYSRAAALKKAAVEQDLNAQFVQGELSARREANAYLDQMARYASEQAKTLNERNAIELAALKRRQDEEAYALAASNALKVSTGEISAMAAAEAELRQRNLSIAEEESALRRNAIEASRADLEARTSALQNQIDVLGSQSAIAETAVERLKIDEQIRDLSYDMAIAIQQAITVQNGATAEQEAAAKARIAALKQIHANEKRAAYTLDRAYANTSNALENAARAIGDHDWYAATKNLIDAFQLMQDTLKSSSASLASKIGAVAGVAAGIGNMIGGTGGSAISGAASGAMAGFTLGGPVGAAIGGALGFVGGIFGSSKAKKRARQQAAAQAAAEEAQRVANVAAEADNLRLALLEAEGKTVELTEAKHQAYIASLAAENKALGEQVWQAQQKAEADAKAAEALKAATAAQEDVQSKIDALTLSSSELELQQREKQRAAWLAANPALGDLIDKLYGLQDSAAASEKATAALQAANDAATRAAEQQASVMQGLADAFSGVVNGVMDLTRSLNEFGDSLGRPDFSALSPKQAYAASKAALNDALATGQFDLVQALGQAFVEASKAVNGGSAAYIQDRAYAQSIAYSAAAANQGRLSGIGSVLAGLRGFAAGGSFEVGGSGPPDSKLFSRALSPGEMVNVTRPGAANDNGTAALVAELRVVQQQLATANARLANLEKTNERMDRNINQGSEAGTLTWGTAS